MTVKKYNCQQLYFFSVRICKTNSLGNREGIFKSYYYNGQLYVEANFIDDIENGIFKSYYLNGQLFQKGNYIYGKKNGIYKSYYEHGQLWEEKNYINDVIVE